MAYVGGGFSPELEALVEQAGYTTARTIRRGIVQTIATRFELHVVRIGPYDDVTNRATWAIDPGLPTFVARMHGVSDLPSGKLGRPIGPGNRGRPPPSVVHVPAIRSWAR